jgi:hypothetical protein
MREKQEKINKKQQENAPFFRAVQDIKINIEGRYAK